MNLRDTLIRIIQRIAILLGLGIVVAIITLIPNHSDMYIKGCNEGIQKVFENGPMQVDSEKLNKFCKDLAKEKVK